MSNFSKRTGVTLHAVNIRVIERPSAFCLPSSFSVPDDSESQPYVIDHEVVRAVNEIDTTIHHIMNSTMHSVSEDRLLSSEDRSEHDAGKSKKNSQYPEEHPSKGSFRLVRSLEEMWQEEKARAERLGLLSPVAAPSPSTPEDPSRVNNALIQLHDNQPTSRGAQFRKVIEDIVSDMHRRKD